MTAWFYGRDGQTVGPVDESEIRSLLASGGIGPNTYVWRDGFGFEWKAVRNAGIEGVGLDGFVEPKPESIPRSAADPISNLPRPKQKRVGIFVVIAAAVGLTILQRLPNLTRESFSDTVVALYAPEPPQRAAPPSPPAIQPGEVVRPSAETLRLPAPPIPPGPPSPSSHLPTTPGPPPVSKAGSDKDCGSDDARSQVAGALKQSLWRFNYSGYVINEDASRAIVTGASLTATDPEDVRCSAQVHFDLAFVANRPDAATKRKMETLMPRRVEYTVEQPAAGVSHVSVTAWK